MSNAEEKKDSPSIYLDLAKMAQASTFNRRSYEWKITYGLWTGIGLLTYFVLSNSERISNFPSTFLGILYLIFSLLWLFLWQAPLRRAHLQDTLFKHYYMHRAEGREANWPRSVTYREVLRTSVNLTWIYTYSPFLVTVLLLIASWLLIARSTPPMTGQKIVLDQPIPNSDLKVQVLKKN